MAASAQEIGKLVVPIIAEIGEYVAVLGQAATITADWAKSITGYVREAVSAFREFELAQSRIVGLVGDSRENVKAMGKDMLDLSVLTGKSAVELSEAMFFIESSGLRGAKAMDALKMSAMGSAAGMGSVKGMAQAVVSATVAYHKMGLTAQQTSDILVATARAGHLDAGSLAGAMSRIMPLGAAMGISFADLGANMAVMTKAGATAAEASTSLGGVMTAMLKPSKDGADALASVGLSYKDVRKVAAGPGGLIKAMLIVNEAFGHQEDQIARVFRGQRGLRGILAVINSDMTETAKVMKDVHNATGSTDTAFAAFTETLQYGADAAKQVSQAIMIELGEQLAPVLKLLVEPARAMVRAFQKASPAVKSAVAAVLAVVAAMASLVVVIKIAGIVFNFFFGGIGIWGGAVVLAIVAATVAAAGLIAAFGGIGAVVERIKEKARQAWAWLKPVRQAVTSLFNTISILVPIVFDKLKAAALDAWERFSAWANINWEEVRDVARDVILAIEFGLLNIPQVAEFAWTSIRLGFLIAMEEVKHFFVATIPAAFWWLRDLILATFTWVGQLIRNSFMTAIKNVRAMWAAVFGWMGANWKTIAQYVLNTVAFAMQAAAAAIVAAIGAAFVLTARNWKTWLRSANSAGWATFALIGKSIIDNLSWAFQQVFDNATSIFKKMTSNIGNLFRNLGLLMSGKKNFGQLWTGLDERFAKAKEIKAELPQPKFQKWKELKAPELKLTDFELPDFKFPDLPDFVFPEFNVPLRKIGEAEKELRKLWNAQKDGLKESFAAFRARKLAEWGLPDVADMAKKAEAIAKPLAEAGATAGKTFSHGFAKEATKLDAVLFDSAEAVGQRFAFQQRLTSSFEAKQGKGPDKPGNEIHDKRVEELLKKIAANTGKDPLVFEEA